MKPLHVLGVGLVAAVAVVATSLPAEATQRALLRTGAVSTNAGYEVVAGETAVNASSPKQLRVACPAGKRATAAGWGVLDATGVILEGEVTYFEPAYDGSNWLANAVNRSSYQPQWKLRLRVICVSA